MRAISFELFSSKIQEAVDDLDDCGRYTYNRGIVDEIWENILSPKLLSYVEAFKV